MTYEQREILNQLAEMIEDRGYWRDRALKAEKELAEACAEIATIHKYNKILKVGP